MSKLRLKGATSGFVELAAPDVADDGVLTLPTSANGFGRIIAVKDALKTDAETFTSVAAGANVAVGGLSITHALAASGNRLIISAYFGAAATSDGTGLTGIAIDDGSGLIAIGDADGVRTQTGAGGFISDSGRGNTITAMPSITFVHAPGVTTSQTYTVRAINIGSSSKTLFINRTEADGNSQFIPRAASALVIQEVAV
jgi:hypothetical protein